MNSVFVVIMTDDYCADVVSLHRTQESAKQKAAEVRGRIKHGRVDVRAWAIND